MKNEWQRQSQKLMKRKSHERVVHCNLLLSGTLDLFYWALSWHDGHGCIVHIKHKTKLTQSIFWMKSSVEKEPNFAC